MVCDGTVGKAVSKPGTERVQEGLGLLLPHGVALLWGEVLAFALNPIERLDGVKPFHGLAGLPGVVRMCPLGLDRLVELAARMGHAAVSGLLTPSVLFGRWRPKRLGLDVERQQRLDLFEGVGLGQLGE